MYDMIDFFISRLDLVLMHLAGLCQGDMLTNTGSFTSRKLYQGGLQLPLNIMPRILASGEMFGILEMTSLVGVNITGCIEEQKVAHVGHCCSSPGMGTPVSSSGLM